MLILDIHRVLALREIENSNQYLVKNGFTYHTAHRLLHSKTSSISYRHMEQLCMLLHCSIEDLFAWKPEPGVREAKKHPLGKLRNRQSEGMITPKLKNLNVNELREVHNFISQLKNKQDDEVIMEISTTKTEP